MWCKCTPTRPVASRGPWAVRAGVANGEEDRLPASRGVAPVVWLQDECALGAIGDHEAVHNMVELAAVAAAFVDVAHQLPCLTAVRGILAEEGSRWGGGTKKYVSTWYYYYCYHFIPDPFVLYHSLTEFLHFFLVITAPCIFFVLSTCLLILSYSSTNLQLLVLFKCLTM